MLSADPKVLERGVHQGYAHLFDHSAGVMDRCVNFGTHLLPKCHDARTFPAISPMLLGRHVIEMLDAMSVLVRRACIDPCKLLLRSQFEAGLGLLYIAERDSLQRARQYDVFVKHSRVEMHRRLDPSTEVGKQFLAEWNRDAICRTLPFKNYESAGNVKRLEDQLAEPDLSVIEQEWQRMKKEQKAKRKANLGAAPLNWYSMFRGPANVQNLARHLKKSGFYEVVYRRFATYSHAADVHVSARAMAAGGGAVLPLRYPRDLVYVVQFAVTTTLEAYRMLIKIYLNDDQREYVEWYTQILSADFMRIAESNLTDPRFKD